MKACNLQVFCSIFLLMIECMVSESKFRELLPEKLLSLLHRSCLSYSYQENRWPHSESSDILHVESIATFNKPVWNERNKIRKLLPNQIRASFPLRGGGSIFSMDEVSLQPNDALHDEVAALEAIYGTDIHVSSHYDDSSQPSSIVFGVMLGPSLRLRLICPATYPRDPPTVVLDAAVNASAPAVPPPSDLARASASLRAHLAPLQESLRGAAMILDLVASAQEWAADDAAAAAASAAAGEKSRRGPAPEDPAEVGGGADGGADGDDAVAGRLVGTPVTPAAFAQLRTRMLRELPPPAGAAPERASPLTGREIWQRRAQEGGAAAAGAEEEGGGGASAEAGSGAEGSDAGPDSEASATGTDSDE
jgi:hypothetical protein